MTQCESHGDIMRAVTEQRRRLDDCKDSVETRMLTMERDSLTRLAHLETQISEIAKDIANLVTKAQFEPVKLIAYGLAGGVLTTVLAYMMFAILHGTLENRGYRAQDTAASGSISKPR
jgi:hypothetical protein